VVSAGSAAADASHTATIGELRTSQMKTSSAIKVMERLEHELDLDLALEIFSYTTIKPAPRPIPPDSLPNTGIGWFLLERFRSKRCGSGRDASCQTIPGFSAKKRDRPTYS
jgi:hypothetical protein